MKKLRTEIITEPDNLNSYSGFIQNHPRGVFFQTHSFYKSCINSNNITPHIIVAFEDDEIAGVLQFFTQYQISIPGLKRITARNIIWGGPIALNDDSEIIEQLLKTYILSFNKSALYTQVRNLFDTTPYIQAFKSFGFKDEQHLNIIIDLTKTEEELWNEVNSKRRNEIRKANKEGVSFELDQSSAALKDSYNILKQVYSRAKLPLPHFSHFLDLFNQSDNESGLRICTAKFERKIIGCMLVLFYKETVFDYFAGSQEKYYSKCPNDLIPWEVFKWAKLSGYKKFDFGGAGNPDIPYGVRDYKKKFGGVFVNYGRYERIHNPLLFNLAKISFRLWQKLRFH